MALKGPEVLGQYELLSLMAAGGMAEIFLARQTGIRGFEKLVVVKKILPALIRHKEFVEMFFDEARIAARLRHSNIVQIYDLGQSGDDYYIAMEYLEGESLREVVVQAFKVDNQLPPELAAFIIANICDGLDYAHKFRNETGKPLNIIHRDVSPNNIIILYSGGVKLVDFGVAKTAVQAHRTEVGVLRGKLSYMSPEQCLGKSLDHRSDVFSAGVVLWEMLAQRRLFKRETEHKTVKAVISAQVPPAMQYRREVPKELDAIAQRALEKDLKARYQSAGEMGDAIRDVLTKHKAIVGHQEIAIYMQSIFSEKAKQKHDLLEKLRSDPHAQVDLDTEDTSQSRFDAVMEGNFVDLDESDPLIVGAETAVTEDLVTEIPTTRLRPPDNTPTQLKEDVKEIPTSRVRPPAVTPTVLEPLERELPSSRRTAPAIPPFLETQEDGEEIEIISPPTDMPTIRSEIPREVVVREKRWPLILALGAVTMVLAAGVTLLSLGDQEPGKIKGPDSASVAPAIEQPPAEADPEEDFAIRPDKLVMLDISSKPSGCKVKVNGIQIPTDTPIKDLALDPGMQHSVTVICEGAEPETRRVSGKPGERVALDFSPAPRTGLLRLDTVPWSVIYLGKRKLGITPLMGIKLPAGKHRLTAINKDLGLKKTFSITIRPDRTTTRQIKFSY
jgi:serine/threonine protein kinase